MKKESIQRANTGTDVPVSPPVIVGPSVQMEYPSGYPYSNPAGTEYPVAASIPLDTIKPKETKEIIASEDDIKEVLQTVSDCGFNVTLWTSGGHTGKWVDHINDYFKVSSALGLRTILNPLPVLRVKQIFADATNKVPDGYEYITAYNDHTLKDYVDLLNIDSKDDNLWGYKLKDEPSFAMWGYEGLTAAVGEVDLQAMYRTFLQNARRHVAFFTLIADISRAVSGEAIYNTNVSNKDKYELYLKALRNKFNPSMISVDIYPIMEYTTVTAYSTDFHGYYMLNRYYYILEAIGKFSTDYGIPFWMYLISTQQWIYNKEPNSPSTKFPHPTKGVLRYQALTALAYGFQGLVFWTYGKMPTEYYDPIAKIKSIEYLDAPYVNGKTTQVWNNCKDVMSEIKTYGKALLNARFQEARHVYGPNKVIEFEETTKLTFSIGCITSASAKGRGFVITRLSKGTNNYLAIVSHDPYEEQSITLTIDTRYDWNEVVTLGSPSEMHVDPAAATGGMAQTITRRLEPGGMILIYYKPIKAGASSK